MAPPPSAYPKIADGTLTSPDRAGWPAIPGYQLPQQPLRAFHLNFGADWSKGIVSVEPPEIGKPFTVSVPAVDRRRQRPRRHPPAGHRGAAGDAGRLELSRRLDRRAGSSRGRDRIVHFRLRARSADRERASDPRLSIEERYRNRDEYVGKFAAATLDLVARGYVLPEDVADLLKHAGEHYDWATQPRGTAQR